MDNLYAAIAIFPDVGEYSMIGSYDAALDFYNFAKKSGAIAYLCMVIEESFLPKYKHNIKKEDDNDE